MAGKDIAISGTPIWVKASALAYSKAQRLVAIVGSGRAKA